MRTVDDDFRLTPIDDADAVVFETDRRYVVLELVESPIEDVVDDDAVVGYFSFPWHAGNGVNFHATRFGFGVLDGALQFSKVFTNKEGVTLGTALPEDRIRDIDREIEFGLIQQLSRQRATTYEPAALERFGLGTELRILYPVRLVEQKTGESVVPTPQESDD